MSVQDPHIEKVRIVVLGPLRVDGGAPPVGPRDRVVLAALAVRPGEPVSVERLCDALWGDQPPASATKNLQGCINRLRKILGYDAIETSPWGYRLAVPRDVLDSQRFEQLTGRARELLMVGEADRAAFLLDQALGLFAGQPFDDLAAWAPGIIEAERLQELRLSAEELHTEALLGAGSHDEVLHLARARVAEQPLREHRHLQLALAQYRTGRRSDALQTLRSLRRRLRDELGADPSEAAAELELAVLRQDTALMLDPLAGDGSAECPWPGLSAYDVGTAESFCGRELDIDACLRLLADRGSVAIVGPSGSGKSSLLRAGIGTALAAAGRQIQVVTPGNLSPDDIGTMLRLPPSTVLLVDQLEEVFDLSAPPARRRAYLAALVERARNGALVVALRSDRIAELAGEPQLARLLERGWYLLSAMRPGQLRAAIETPARQAGLVLEPGLVDLLVREVQDEPGALPLLSHALVETWNRREGRTLTVDGYLDSGGVRGSVAQSAEQMWDGVVMAERDQLRALLLRLVTTGPEGEPTRARIARDRVVSGSDQARLVEMLVASRLVTSDDGELTLAHEALARAWPRLRGWLEDDAEGQRILHHLSSSADAWLALGKPDSELYRGVRLARVLEWQALRSVDLAPLEVEFIDACRQLRDQQERSLEEQSRRQALTNRRLRMLLASAMTLCLVAAVAGFAAARSAHLARAAGDAASATALRARAEAVGTSALTTTDVSTSLLLAVAAAEVAPEATTRADLAKALADRPELLASAPGPGQDFARLAVSPDGRRVAATDITGRVHLYDARDLAELASTHAGSGARGFPPDFPVAFAPRRAILAVGSMPPSARPVTLLNASTLAPIARQLGGWPAGTARATEVSFSADGTRVVVLADAGQSPDGMSVAPTALVWSLRHPAAPLLRLRVDNIAQRPLLSPDGRTLFTSAPVAAYDVRTGRPRFVRRDVSTYFAFDLDPSGTRLAVVGSQEGAPDIEERDARTGRLVRRFPGLPPSTVWQLRFSPDGREVAANSDAGATYVWDTRTGRLTHTLQAHDARGWGLGFGPNGATVYTAGTSRVLQAWDLTGYRSYLQRVHLGTAHVTPGAGWVWPGPSGERFAYTRSVDGGNRAEILDPWRRRSVVSAATIADPPFITGAWRPDAKAWATGGAAGEVTVVDAVTGATLARRPVGHQAVAALAYTPDGSRLVISEYHRLFVADSRTLRVTAGPFRIAKPIGWISPAPDNRHAFLTLGSPSRQWWRRPPTNSWAMVDLRDGAVGRTGRLSMEDSVVSTFAPSGDQVAVTGLSGQAELVDTASGQGTPLSSTADLGVIESATYNRDGTLLVTGASQQTAQLWDTRAGTLIGTVTVPTGVAAGAFRPDGSLAITSSDGLVYRWDPTLSHAVEYACRAAGRSLSATEWHQAFPMLPFRNVCP